jgi:hypothetical protein
MSRTTLRRLLGHELRVYASYGMWATRRRHGVPAGASGFGYARGQAVMLYALTFVCVVETVGVSVLLRDYPVVHRVMLVLDVYTVVMVLGLHAASVTRPHVLTPEVLRVRRGAQVDLRIPVERIAAVRRENRFTHTPVDGELNLDIASQTSITLELTEPVRHLTLLGGAKEVGLVRLHAEDPDALAAALTRAMRERTPPGPALDRPV